MTSWPVSALASISSSPGSSRGLEHFTLTVPLFTQVYQWVPANFMVWVALRWPGLALISSRGE